MRAYRPKSYSQQAKELANCVYKTYKETGIKFDFSESYKHPLIRQRAAKMFGKMIRKGV
jgi:hypothetical protein